MSVFPSLASIKYSRPEAYTMRGKMLRTRFDDLGKQQRKVKWLYSRRFPVLTHKNLTQDDYVTLRQFFIDAQNGNSFSFFFTLATEAFTGEYVGTGDASTKVFNLPCASASTYTLKVAGATQTLDSDYYFGSGTGPDTEDVATFATASTPATGTRITIDFVGNLKIKCVFADDMISFESLFAHWRRSGISLEGLLNDE